MKKWLTVLAVITCVFGLTACGSSAASDTTESGLMTEEEAISTGENMVAQMVTIITNDQVDQYASNDVLTAAFDSMESAMEDVGSFTGTYKQATAEVTEDGITINLLAEGTDHDATILITTDSTGALTAINTNVKYSLGELMAQAGLNTVLGMGTTFVILILISFIISLFPLIGKAQKANEEKKAAAAKKTAPAPAAPAAAAAPAPAAPAPAADPMNDSQLVAVIAAAVAAAEGRTTTDGFVVRSIRKVSRKNWR